MSAIFHFKTFIIFTFIILYLLEKCNSNEIGISAEYGTDERMRSLRILCPYNKFCGSNPLKKIESSDHEPCCEECSCENNCFETGSCCPDTPLSRLADPKYACKHLWDFGKNAEENNRPIEINFWHHVIDDCPGKAKARSYQKCLTPTEVLDYVIVSDTRTGKLYRNKHCAECNGIHVYDNLNLHVTCIDIYYTNIFSLTTAAERDNYLMENCSLMSYPPEKLIGTSYCLPDEMVISVCNYSGKWDNYDSNIEAGCMTKGKDQNMVFRNPSTSTYYANVFCFLCNVPTGTKKTDTCKIRGYSNKTKSSLVSFSAVLNLKVWGNYEVNAKDTRCSSTQIWDPFTKLCRRMFCPFRQIPVYGRCQGLFSNINGYSLSIHFKVIFKNGILAIDSILLDILKNRVNRALGKDITCGLCRIMILTKDVSASQIIFRHVMFTTDECPYHTLLERIRQLAIKKEMHLQFRYRNQDISIVLILIFEEIDYLTDYIKVYESVLNFCYEDTHINGSILLHCPIIELSREELYRLKINNISNHPAADPLHMNESDAMPQQICVDSYFLTRQINSASYAVNSFTIYRMLELLGIMLTTLSL